MINPSSINIICLGHWNTKIFTAQWVAEYIFKCDISKIQGLLNQNEIEVAYKYSEMGITFFPRSSVIELKLEIFENEQYLKIVETLNSIISNLPHTPIKGIGFNINYELENSELPLIVSKTIDGIKKSCDNNYNFNSFTLTKENDNFQINLNVSNIQNREGKIMNRLNYNFHFPTQREFNPTLFDSFLEIIKLDSNG